MTETIYIPERFRKVIQLHIVKNMLSSKGILRTPLLLGIHGPSGDGKTFQCEQVLKEMGVESFLISGGQLESPRAGEPAALLRSTYLRAGAYLEKKDAQATTRPIAQATAVLINDFDTGVGNWGDLVQYTANRQILFGELMHLTDYPHLVEGRVTRRIPIIVTGNDFTRLHEPLVRAGRMVSFAWLPTGEEKAGIISRIFPQLSPEECLELITAFTEEPVSFYAALASTLLDEEIYRYIQKFGAQKCIAQINAGARLPKMSIERVNYQTVLSAGQALSASGKLQSHLKNRSTEIYD